MEQRVQALRALGRPGRVGARVRGGGGRSRPAERDDRRDGGARARLRGGRAQKNGDAAAQGLGRSRGGFSTKLHVLVDALGNPLRFTLTSGAAGDNPQAIPLLDGIRAGEVIADRGYDADKTLAHIQGTMGAIATIPPKKSRTVQRDCDYAAYRERHLVECLIGKLKHFRRLATRYDKYGKRFLAFVHLASTLIWLK
jgi:transposase